MNYLVIDSPIGKLTLCGTSLALSSISFGVHSEYNNPSEILVKTHHELNEYFNGTRFDFDIPLAPMGTEFQKKVWEALVEVPYGQTASYKDIACKIGNDKASRAVGMANNKNPIPIIIPCHRIIGSSGELTGYAGGLDVKQYLLNLEKEHSTNK